MSSREDARKNRAQSRARRREEPEAPESDGSGDEPDEGDHLEGVKQAAKVAAVGAAVGAATAAARALTQQDRGGSDEEASEPTEAPRAEEESIPSEADREGEDSGTGQEREGATEAEPEEQPQERRASESSSERRETGRPPGAVPEEASNAVRIAREQLRALLGLEAETVSAFERTHDGWLITLEVVELARIPDSTDLLASYEVDLDENCGLRRYARIGRYARGHANSGEQR